MAIVIGIYLALILSILHYVSTAFVKFTKKHISHILSFSAGILIGILFLELLPMFAQEATKTNYLLFLLPLMGFVAFHIMRSFTLRTIKNKSELNKRFRRIHILAFYLEHLILGFFLTLTFDSPFVPLILFLPFALLIISSSILLNIIDETSKTMFPRLILASSTITGAIVGSLISFNKPLLIGVFGYALGGLFYIISRDIVPIEEKKESTAYFLIGILIITALIILKGV